MSSDKNPAGIPNSPPISAGGSAIAPARDDIQAHRSTRAGRTPANRGGGSGPGTGHLATLYLALVLMIGAGAIGGWYLMEQQKALEGAQAALVTADQRLARLENRLSMTDQALNESGTDLQDQISLWEKEARRAWQIAWKQNRPRIEALEGSLSDVDKRQKTEAETLRGVRSTVAEHAEVLGSQAEIVDRIASLDLQMAQAMRSQRDLTDGVNGMRTTVAGMKASVGSNSEAIRSIDAFRIQTNRAILELRGGPAAPPPAQ